MVAFLILYEGPSTWYPHIALAFHNSLVKHPVAD